MINVKKEYWKIAFEKLLPIPDKKQRQSSGLWKHFNYQALDKKLSESERMQLIHSICDSQDFQSEINKYYDYLDTVDDFTPAVVSGWQKSLQPLEIAANYLLAHADGVYSQEQLCRKEYEKDRTYTTKPFCDVVPIQHEGDQLSFVEKVSIHRERDPLSIIADELTQVNGFNEFTDLEKQIALFVCMDMAKVAIQKELSLSASQLLTCLKRMGKKMRPEHVEPITKKLCRKCSTEKGVDNFYKDKRNRDGLRSFCRQCIKVLRKKSYKHSAETVDTIGA